MHAVHRMARHAFGSAILEVPRARCVPASHPRLEARLEASFRLAQSSWWRQRVHHRVRRGSKAHRACSERAASAWRKVQNGHGPLVVLLRPLLHMQSSVCQPSGDHLRWQSSENHLRRLPPGDQRRSTMPSSAGAPSRAALALALTLTLSRTTAARALCGAGEGPLLALAAKGGLPNSPHHTVHALRRIVCPLAVSCHPAPC